MPVYFYFYSEPNAEYATINEAKTLWRVDINISHGYGEGMLDYLSVTMDSRTGEVLDFQCVYWGNG